MNTLRSIQKKTRGLCIGTLTLCASTLFAAPITITVNTSTDTNVGAGGQYGATTDLRGALNQVNVAPNVDGYIINFNTSGPITLGAMLPLLNLVQAYPLTIDGGSGAPILIDGANTYRGLIANQGAITLKNLQIQNVNAIGGNGGVPGGGGGMGAGAGLLVANNANVSLSKVKIQTALARGGNGGVTAANSVGGGGGGGLGGLGGTCQQQSGSGSGSGGGGGLGGKGGNSTVLSGAGGGGGINCGTAHTGLGGDTNVAGSPGGGVGGAGGGASTTVAGGASGGGGGGAVTASNGSGGGGGVGGASSQGTGYKGGNGGLGGGGGGGAFIFGGGNGGFGGGGGGGGSGTGSLGDGAAGGNGGFGGGGGGSNTTDPNPPGNGGFGGGGGSGSLIGIAGTGGTGAGQGSINAGSGGGGAGFGGAIFVNSAAKLMILDSFTTANNTTNPGTGFRPGWAAGNDCFFASGSVITLDPKGSNITIVNSIADDSPASFVGVQSGTTSGTAQGASITIGNTLNAPGTVTFPSTNQSTYSGPTLVRNGNFALNGTITSPVTVFNGARLQGVGNINNSVQINSGGSIHAGNSIGTLTMKSLTLQSQSNLQLDLDLSLGSNTSSVFKVNGPLAINGANLVLAYDSQNIAFSPHTYNFIQYQGSSPGTFNPIISNLPLGLVGMINYLPNVVQLELTPLFSAVALIGVGANLSNNEQTVLNYLLALMSVPDIQNILLNFAYLKPDQLKDALDSISPARNEAATFFTNQAAFGMGKIPLDRLAEGRILRLNESNGAKKRLGSIHLLRNEALVAMGDQIPTPNVPANFDSNDNNDMNIGYSLGMKSNTNNKPRGKTRTEVSTPQNFSLWASGFGDFISLDGQNSNPKINDTAAGAIVGFDYYGSQNGVFTVSTGYIHNDITEKHHVGSGSSNGGILSFYGTGSIGNGYIEAGILGGYNRFDMSRNVVMAGPFPITATAKSSFNDWMVMPHLSGGYDWMMDWGVIEPFGSLDLAVSFQKSYKEKGASPLNTKIDSHTPFILRSQFGLNFYETWECPKHACIFQQSASFINKSLFNTSMTAAVIIAPTALPAGAPSSFTVDTYDKNLNLGGIGAEIFYKHKPSGFFMSGAYQGEFGTSFMSNDITGTLGFFF